MEHSTNTVEVTGTLIDVEGFLRADTTGVDVTLEVTTGSTVDTLPAVAYGHAAQVLAMASYGSTVTLHGTLAHEGQVLTVSSVVALSDIPLSF